MTQFGDTLWQPSADRKSRSRMASLQAKIAAAHQIPVDDYFALHRWSVKDPASFWQFVADDLQVKWQSRPERALIPPAPGKMRGARWFVGGTLNFAENLLPTRMCADRIVSLVEGNGREVLSTSALRLLVARMARSLRQQGVGKGDRVGAVIGNGIEAIVAMLGTAAVGGIWSSCSPDFGTDAVVDRLAQVEPKVLFFTTAYQYGGKRFVPCDRLAAIRSRLPSVETVVLCSPLQDTYDGELGIAFSDFLDDSPDDRIVFEPMAFDDPLFIMFSSGTTGIPKCIVHGVGGTLLQHKKELAYHTDLGSHSRLLYYTTCGWMMWNWMVSALAEDACLILFEGSVAQPDLMTLWRTIEHEGVTAFGTSPKFISACMQANMKPSQVNLSSLDTVLSTGAPLVPEQFAWVYDAVKKDVHLASISGGTDIISCFMLGVPTLPVYAGEIQAPGLGMDIHAFDDAGRDVLGGKGELVCTTPFPSMPLCFWNDPQGRKYSEAYFDFFSQASDHVGAKQSAKEVWRHGDYISLTPHRGVIVFGRSDATLNPGGVRIGTAEIYRQVETMDQIEDSIAVGERIGDDTEILLFVKLRQHCVWSEGLEQAIRVQIKTHLTPRHLPRTILPVSEIPYTRSGKKVEMAVTQAIHGEPVANLSVLVNPAAMEPFVAYGQKKLRG